MARVQFVKKARKSQGKCGKCGKPLPVGSPYRWWKFRYGGRRVRCMAAACNPKRSDLTQSDTLGTVYDAQDALTEACRAIAAQLEAGKVDEALEDLREAAEEICNTAEEVAESCREAADAWENGNEILEERADAAEAWYDALEAARDEVDNVEDGHRADVEAAMEALETAANDCEL